MSYNPLVKTELSLIEQLKAKFCITPENIGYFVYPLAKYVHEAKPDYILALDTGGRIAALALHTLHQQLYGSLPTQDHRIHFLRVSHHFTPETSNQQLKSFVDYVLANNERPNIFVVDDWLTAGTTANMVRQSFDQLSHGKANVHLGVMRELFTGKADVAGDTFSIARCNWHGKPNLIGVAYTDSMKPYAIHSPEARLLRQKISTCLKESL